MTPIDDRINQWLSALERELAQDDPAVRQDAVADAREHLLAARADLPDTATDTEIDQLLDAYGDPIEVANSYRDAERLLHGEHPRARASEVSTTQLPTVTTATHPARPAGAGWFSVIRDQEAWTSWLYMLLALPIGIASFVFTIVGGAVSGSLLILIFGIPLALAFLASIRGIALVHGRLVEALLGERMPRRSRPISDEIGTSIIARVKYWLRDRRTWTSIVYNVTMLPLGIAYFVSAVVITALAGFALVAPLFMWILIDNANVNVDWWDWVLSVVLIPAGVLGVFGVLHLARFVGGLHGRYTKLMLVGGEGESRRRRPVAPEVSIARAAVLLAIAGAVFVGVGVVGHAIALSTSHEQTMRRSASGLTTVDLRSGTSDVRFIADPSVAADAIKVEATTRVHDGHRMSDAVKLTHHGDTASITGGDCEDVWPLFAMTCGNELRIRVAPDSQLVLTGKLSTGDITLGGGFRQVNLATDTGDILGETDAPHVDLATNTGDIDATLGDGVRALTASADTGDVNISAPGAWNVSTSSDTGDTSIDVPRDSSSDHHMELHTDTGDISVRGR